MPYKLRTVLFPLFLAIPMKVFKTLGLDFEAVVKYSPTMIHTIWIIVMDWNFFQLGNKTVGKSGTDIAMSLYLFNHTFGQQMHRLFTCSYEAILGVISLNYFMDVTSHFDKNFGMVVILQSISFIIRNTSPIGWVVILLYKACYSKGFNPNFKLPEFGSMIQNYFLGFFAFFLPIFLISIMLDSEYYEGKLTVVPYNFINVNVFEGLSQTFGADSPYRYLNLEIPSRFNIYTPVLILGICHHYYSSERKRVVPYLIYYSVTILVFLSCISHKEPKFLLPIFPPFFLFIGQYLADTCVKKRPGFVKFYVIFGVVLECLINAYFVHYHEVGAFVPMAYIKSQYPGYQSLITNCKFEANYLSLNHRKGD